MLNLRAVILIFLSGCAVVSAQSTNEQPGIIVEAAQEADYNLETGVITTTNGITVRYQEAVLTAQKASLNQTNGEVIAQGNVRLQRGPALLVADSIRYNFLTKKIIGENFKLGEPPFFVQSDVMVGNQAANVYVGAEGLVTSDDHSKPRYTVHAKTLIVAPGEYIIAKHATLRAGNVPVFYFPYYRRSLKHRSNHFVFIPGYRSRFGPFLLTTYNWYWGEKLDGAIHLDERAKPASEPIRIGFACEPARASAEGRGTWGGGAKENSATIGRRTITQGWISTISRFLESANAFGLPRKRPCAPISPPR